jgi:hypothetical protein
MSWYAAHDDAFLSFIVPFVWESVLLLMCFQTFTTLLAQCIAQSKEQNRARIYIEEVGPTSLLFPKTNCNFLMHLVYK